MNTLINHRKFAIGSGSLKSSMIMSSSKHLHSKGHRKGDSDVFSPQVMGMNSMKKDVTNLHTLSFQQMPLMPKTTKGSRMNSTIKKEVGRQPFRREGANTSRRPLSKNFS